MNLERVASGMIHHANPRTLSWPRYLIVGESAAHRWIVKDNRGRLGAVFRSASVALRFAQREAGALGCGIVIDSSPVELECLKG
jgi:hypothetical protein